MLRIRYLIIHNYQMNDYKLSYCSIWIQNDMKEWEQDSS